MFASVFHYGDVKDQNARLRRDLNKIQADEISAENAKQQLRELMRLNGLKFVGDLPTVTVRVSATSTSNFEKSIEINRGSNSGIEVGMPVVATGGLVGRVVETSKTRSTVLLITDRSSSVGVRLLRTTELGVANGRGGNDPLSVDMIAPDATVRVGDSVVTSGLSSSFFPPDIPVGKVTSAPKAKAGELQRPVSVRSLIDFERLDFLKVIQWSPNGQ